ncbi:MAG: DUF3108 domain-containing protein [Parafilimonas sp.]
MRKLSFVLLFSWLILNSKAQNLSFQAGEKIKFTVYYTVAGIYFNAGTASFSVNEASTADANTYHLIGEGSTNSKYDWIFKVRDRYESYLNTENMQPVKFIRHVSEGKYKKHEEVVFNRFDNTATTKKGTYNVPENVQDVISSVYLARNLDYSKYKPGDKITFNMFFGNNIYNMYIKYMGKEIISTKYGRFNAIKLQPLLLKGNAFKGGEDMTVWVTDDNNHLPVRIQSRLTVGSIKVDLSQYENLKYPLVVN